MKNMFAIDSAFHRWGTNIIETVYINLLWLFFTFVGLGITGGAATVALVTMFRRKSEGKGNVGLGYFWEVFKKQGVLATKVWLILIGCCGIVLFNMTQVERWARIIKNPWIVVILFALQFTMLIQVVATSMYALLLLAYRERSLKVLLFEATVMAYQFLGATVTLMALLAVLIYGSVVVPIFSFVGMSVFAMIAVKILNPKINVHEGGSL